MENYRLGCRAATHHWPDYFPSAVIATSSVVGERRGAGAAQRFPERFVVSVWTTRRESRRDRLDRFHPRVPGASGRDLLCGVHRNALSLARLTDLRATLRPALSPHYEDQRRRVAFECGKYLCRH